MEGLYSPLALIWTTDLQTFIEQRLREVDQAIGNELAEKPGRCVLLAVQFLFGLDRINGRASFWFSSNSQLAG
eukprot:1490647-Rhodomonas_salina.1